MKAFYPLKKSEPADLVEPIVKYLQISQSPQVAFTFRQILTKINQLRNKTTCIDLPTEITIDVLNKYIPAIEMYVKYALILVKHLNWSKQYGVMVEDMRLVWYDSFNQKMSFMKNQIHYDVFCCFYNLGIMYFEKASLLSLEDLNTSRKQSIKAAKIGYYLFNQMKTVYYPLFVNTGFSDTNFSHIEMLQSLCQGIIYKNLFNIFKQDQYQKGINKIACLAGLAQTNFYNAYQVGTQFFVKSSHISPHIKTQLLSFSYVQSLFHDTMFNTKYAKYFQEKMDDDKNNIIYLLAYQKKALRLLDLGLKNQNVTHLLNQRPDEKKELQKIKPEIEDALNKNLMRNKEIYKKQEIKQEQLPPPMDPPKQYIAKPIQPENIKISYQGPIAGPFAKLIDNQSKSFMNQLQSFSKNRISGMQSAHTKLQKNVEIIYNDNFVNFYLNLENTTKNKGIPESLKQKINAIQSNGGKGKLDLQINIIKKNSQQIGSRFDQLKQQIHEEQNKDSNYRKQYGNKWNRAASSAVNRNYINQLQLYEKKAEQANNVNQKIIDKYMKLQKYIMVVDGNDQEIMSVLPKVEVTKFLQENKKDIDQLRGGSETVKGKMQGIEVLTDDIRKFFEKLNLTEIASKYYKQAADSNKREQIFDQIFGKGYKMIESFNEKAKQIEVQAQQVGQVSVNLNKKNKGDQKTKKDFEQVMSKFNDIYNLFKELTQGTAFYTKLNDILVNLYSDLEGFLTARKLEADQLERSINKGGSGGAPNLPSMYPNKPPPKNAGFYIPPPMQVQPSMGFSQMGGGGFSQMGGNKNDMSNMLQDLMQQKASFSTDVFGGSVYQSRYK